TLPRPPRRLLAAVAVGGVLATCGLVALAREQSRTWHDSISLWTQALRSAPDSSECHYGLASALNERGRFDEAIAEYREALRCRPGFPNALNSLGAALAAQGKLDEAISYYAETLRR